MFFTVSASNNTYKVDLDPGWNKINDCWVKGYAVDRTQQDIVETYNWGQLPDIVGNFCVIKVAEQTVKIGHSKDRSFPIWTTKNTISNLYSLHQHVWADEKVWIDCNDKVNTEKILLDGALTNHLTIEQVADLIVNRTVLHAQAFLENNFLPIKCFRSGGLDTAFAHALLNYLNVDQENIIGQVMEPNTWLSQNAQELEKFWAYKQIHHWNQPCFIITGSHGDEYFLRGPNAIAMIMAWHNVDFLNILNQSPNAYHYWYFMKPKNQEIFAHAWHNRIRLKKQYPSWQMLTNQILNMFANDHQHWHLGNTLTWTPQKDLDIARWALCLNIDDLIDNSLNGTLIKNCIKRLDPGILDSITLHKNKPNQ